MMVSQIVLELLTACNFSCPYCRDSSGKNLAMPIDRARAILAGFEALGIRKAQLDGGEPFLYPGIRELIEFGEARGIEIGVYTNGALIDADLARFLAHHPALKLAVTLHPLNPRKDLEATSRGLEALRRVGIRPRLIMVVSSASLRRLPEVLARIPDDGYTLVLNPLVVSGRAFDNAMTPLTVSERRHLAEVVASAMAARSRTHIVDNASVDEDALMLERVQMNEDDEFALHVNTDGDVLPFFSADASTAIGNIRDLVSLGRALGDPATVAYLRRCQLAMKRRVHGRDGAQGRRIVAEDVARAHEAAPEGAQG